MDPLHTTVDEMAQRRSCDRCVTRRCSVSVD
jgi:hypothetical protein